MTRGAGTKYASPCTVDLKEYLYTYNVSLQRVCFHPHLNFVVAAMDEQAATTDPYVDVEEEGEDGAVEQQDVKEEEEEEQPWGDSWNEEWGWEHEGWDGSHDTWNWDDSETTVKAEPVGETSSSSKGDKSWGGNWWSKSWSNNDEKSWHSKDDKSWYSKDDKSWHAKQQWSQRHPPKQEYLD